MEFVSGSLFIRPMGKSDSLVQPGERIDGHVHNFDHLSIFFNGQWHVVKHKPSSDEVDIEIERNGPFFLLIDKDCRHEFTYLDINREPGHAWCVYSHRTPQGEVSTEYTGWLDAYDAKAG